jgi:hypothetical protein
VLVASSLERLWEKQPPQEVDTRLMWTEATVFLAPSDTIGSRPREVKDQAKSNSKGKAFVIDCSGFDDAVMFHLSRLPSH